jgi:hypothetical protein
MRGGVVCLVAEGRGRRRNRVREGSGHILTITDRITDGMFSSVNPSVILSV